MNALFTRSVAVSAPAAAAATDAEIRGVLEPVLEDLSFVTPRDTGTPLYAVSLKYRINAYRPDGERLPPSPCAMPAPRSPSRCASRPSCAG